MMSTVVWAGPKWSDEGRMRVVRREGTLRADGCIIQYRGTSARHTVTGRRSRTSQFVRAGPRLAAAELMHGRVYISRAI